MTAYRRARTGGQRAQRLNLRLSVDELADVAAAAARMQETPSGYAARITVAAARDQLVDGLDPAEVRELVIELIRTRTQVQRAAELHPTADSPPRPIQVRGVPGQ